MKLIECRNCSCIIGVVDDDIPWRNGIPDRPLCLGCYAVISLEDSDD
jgi:hypothetical protein